MQKLIIATIGLSLSMGVAGAAVAQSAGTAGQMPATNGSMPMGSSTMSPSTAPADPAMNTGAAMPGAPMPGAAPSTGMSSDSTGAMSTPPAMATGQSYPRCSATVHDECRQRK